MIAQSPYYADSLRRLTDYLRTHRMRCTPERTEILGAALSLDGHFSADQMYEHLEVAGFHVSKATVYATLQLLAQAGILRRQHFGGSSACYEFAPSDIGMAPHARKSNRLQHLHLVCTRCGNVKEMRDPEVSRLLAARTFRAFSPAYFTLCVYGVCARCARRARKSTSRKS